LSLQQLQIMGVINVTPDSFSDGGNFNNPIAFENQFLHLSKMGADVIDIGAESTRPGAADVDEKTEWQRLSAVLNHINRTERLSTVVSIDTRKEEIALRCLNDFSVGMINSMSGIFSLEALQELVVGARKQHIRLRYCAAHMFGIPLTMQEHPLNRHNVVAVVESFFESAYDQLRLAGFESQDIYLDPGIGFGKNDAANLSIIAKTSEWSKKYNLLLGVSRKGMIGRMLGIENPHLRDHGSKMLETSLALMGAKMIRTHDVQGLIHIKSMSRDHHE